MLKTYWESDFYYFNNIKVASVARNLFPMPCANLEPSGDLICEFPNVEDVKKYVEDYIGQEECLNQECEMPVNLYIKYREHLICRYCHTKYLFKIEKCI